MSDLVAVLKSWNFQKEVQSELENSGYLAHVNYQDEMREFAINNGIDASDLEFYWSELAREWVACAGQVSSWSRLFHGEIGYRSSYLDSLANRKLSNGLSEGLPLHPAEHAFMEFLEMPVGHGIKMTQIAEEKKSQWRSSFSSSLTRISPYESLLAYLYSKLEKNGFVQRNRKLIFNLDNGLCFGVTLDRGRSKNVYQTSVNLNIWHRANINSKFGMGDFRNIVPGFPYYSIVQRDLDVSYGIDAYACIICSLCQSMRALVDH